MIKSRIKSAGQEKCIEVETMKTTAEKFSKNLTNFLSSSLWKRWLKLIKIIMNKLSFNQLSYPHCNFDRKMIVRSFVNIYSDV